MAVGISERFLGDCNRCSRRVYVIENGPVGPQVFFIEKGRFLRGGSYTRASFGSQITELEDCKGYPPACLACKSLGINNLSVVEKSSTA